MSETYCYFIQSGKKGAIKIGVSGDLKQRMAEMQTGNPYQLRLVFAVKCASRKIAEQMEGDLHYYFVSQRVRGEWFNRAILKRVGKIAWLDMSSREIVLTA